MFLGFTLGTCLGLRNSTIQYIPPLDNVRVQIPRDNCIEGPYLCSNLQFTLWTATFRGLSPLDSLHRQIPPGRHALHPGNILLLLIRVDINMLYIPLTLIWVDINMLFVRWRTTTTLRCRSNDHFLTLKSTFPLL